MAVTQADRIEEMALLYKERMGKSVKDYVCDTERPTDILKDLIMHPSGRGARRLGSVVLENKSVKTAGEFSQHAERALKLIRHNLVERKKVVIETTEEVSDTLKSMVGEGILT